MLWRWLIIWVVLLLASAGYLAARAWGLWGQVKELGRELETAQQRVATLQSAMDRLGEPVAPASSLAVFDRPSAARATRDRLRANSAAARRARRASNQPAWARRGR